MAARNAQAKTPVDFAGVLASTKPIERSVRICLAGDLLAEIDSLTEELAQARRSDSRLNELDRAPAIAKRLVELEDAAHEAEVEFRFRAIGRKAWRDLVAANPPSAEEKKAGADHNERFLVEAIAASCVEPAGVTLEQAEQLLDVLTESQAGKLWLACLAANRGTSDVPFSAAASELARPTETSSGSQPDSEYPEASS
jgi:hypothetical protein